MKQNKLRLYFDTSVFGGVFDKEFEVESKRLMEDFDNGKFFIMISSLVLDEIAVAPAFVRSLVDSLPPVQLVPVEITDEVLRLRDEYLARKILTPKSLDDATHVALATVNRADAIVSWNFKHIVRLDKMKQYNQVNFSLGYGILQIVSPQEVVFEEEG